MSDQEPVAWTVPSITDGIWRVVTTRTSIKHRKLSDAEKALYECQVPRAEPPRKGDWIETFTGTKFYPCDPREDEIHLEDIAHALGMSARFGGHCQKFYSVAEHCVLMVEEYAYRCETALRPIDTTEALQVLLHDAEEYIFKDMVRPIKHDAGVDLRDYKRLSTNLSCMIHDKFGLPQSAYWIKALDESMLLKEKERVMSSEVAWNFTPGIAIAQVEPKFWSPAKAKREFLNIFKAYDEIRGNTN